METTQRRDVNELLVNGYFKTARGRSPSCSTPQSASTSSPSLLRPTEYAIPPRVRSTSRGPRGRPPPRPTVEDEAVSLARESGRPAITSNDPPLRGTIDQHPIILEADVTSAEATRLHASPPCAKEDDNPERRFVLLPKPDTSDRKDANVPKGASRPTKQPEPLKESLHRRRSRQDLPALQTKVPRDIPPQFRRSSSAQSVGSADRDLTPKAASYSRTHGELLSPDVQRFPKDSFPASSPRQHVERSATPSSAKRASGTPLQEKRSSSSYETSSRSRRDSNDKLTRLQQLSEEDYGRRRDRRSSPHSSKLSVDTDRRRSGRSLSRSGRHYYSSDSDIGDSDSERSRRHRHRPHQHHRHRELQAEEDDRYRGSRSNRSSGEFKPASRKYSSPLPSPKASPIQLPRVDRERAETFPQRSGSRSPVDGAVSPFSFAPDTPRSSADRLNPTDSPIARPRSRQANPIPIPGAKTYPPPPESLPVATPPRTDPYTPIETRRTVPISQYDDTRNTSARPAPPSPYWQPPPFQPPPSKTDNPVGSYRRLSEDLESGSIAPLPTCPRTTFTRGRNDWLTLPQCPSFDICPSCFDSTIAPTEFRRFFIQAPPRPPEAEVICDFGSSPWYRIAWLLTRKERRRDLNLFYGLANVAATAPQCLGKHEAVRQWHFLVDPKTRTPIHNFNVCSSCVKSIEILLPPIRGIFMRDPNRPMGPARVCDLRFDSKRFIQYFDTLELTADRADEQDAPPDTRALVSLAKRMALVPECQRDRDLTDRPWNIMTQLPEFTVCEECFDDVVWPELEDEKAIPMMFNKALQRLPKASCQLYSPRMRALFRAAVDADDFKLLAAKARERKTVEMAYKANMENLKRQASLGMLDPQLANMEMRRVEEEWRKWE